MAKVAKNTNEKVAHKIAKNTFNLFKEVLVFLGKPLYLLIAGLIILLSLVARSITSISNYFYKAFKKSYKTANVKIRNVFDPVKLFILRTKLKSLNFNKKNIYKRSKIFLPRFSVLFVFGSIFLTIFGFLFWQEILKDLPSVDELVNRKIDMSTKIYDRNGVLLYKIYKDENRTPISLSEIPQQTLLATIAIEDAEFYSHAGFSLRGIARSFVRNIERGELVGGSTITQQLVKNALLSPEKTLSRKIKELILSLQVEARYSKDEILEMYLNEVSYGGTAYGIQEASKVYFNKDAKNLTLSESALLAGLPKSPSRFSPFADIESAINRQREVLNLMKINKFISPEVEHLAISEKLKFSENKIDIKAPHFVMYVKKILAEEYGEEAVETGGLEVITTLDYNIQILAEKAVTEEVNKLKNLKVGNGAAIVLDPKTGEILAMVGSKDYFDTNADGNVNVALRLRQPGSSIKVINYAYALEHGFSPATIINDTSTTFGVSGQLPYSPKNYDGKYRGNITIRSALAESRNIPAVKILASYGVEKMIELGKNLGITSWEDKSRFGLSLTLGGGEVKLLDLTQVYATIANYGKRPNVSPLLSVKNSTGKILKLNECTKNTTSDVLGCEQKQVLDPRVSYLLIDILKDNIARSPAFGSNSQLVIKAHPEVAVKTGTSNDLKDNLTIGFNQNYVVGVWVGNNDNSPMSRIASGITGAAPIWNKIMTGLIGKSTSVSWSVPSGVEKIGVCTITGSLPCNGCPTRSELFLSEAKPTRSCSTQAIENIKNPVHQSQIQGNLREPALSIP